MDSGCWLCGCRCNFNTGERLAKGTSPPYAVPTTKDTDLDRYAEVLSKFPGGRVDVKGL